MRRDRACRERWPQLCPWELLRLVRQSRRPRQLTAQELRERLLARANGASLRPMVDLCDGPSAVDLGL